MKDIRLKELILRNFKGIKEFTLSTGGENLDVCGENGTGKTTLFDAFKWVLFDKDSNNRSDFSIKTLDKDGNAIHFLEHEVEVHLVVNTDGYEVTRVFKKQLMENWVQKRGSADKEFSGHTTSYWVDEVPCKQVEYKAKVNEIIDETVFKLISDPFYFNKILKTQERRNILLEVLGNISDDVVIASNKKLAKLPEILEGRSIEGHKKVIAEKMSKLNDEIKKMPVRIDELSRTLSDGDINYTDIETEKAALEALLDQNEKRLSSSSASAQDYMDLQQQLFNLKEQLTAKRLVIEKAANSGIKALADEKGTLQNELYKLNVEITSMQSRHTGLNSSLKANEGMLETLRKKFEVNESALFPKPDIAAICPTCGQAIPEENINIQYEQMKSAFETAKNKMLDEIEAEGISLKVQNDKLTQDITTLSKNRVQTENRINEIELRLADIETLLSTTTVSVNYGSDPEYVTLENQISELKKMLENWVEADNTELLEIRKDLISQINEFNKLLNNKTVNEKTQDRIQELKAEEKKLAQQYTELEGQKFLMETFTRTKVDLLESSINSKFKYVRFKLFDVQINGGIADCCETLIKGVPWDDANHEGCTNGGLDIINTLTAFYGVTAPIFIDYRESVNRIIPTTSQVINLRVTHDKKLKIGAEA